MRVRAASGRRRSRAGKSARPPARAATGDRRAAQRSSRRAQSLRGSPLRPLIAAEDAGHPDRDRSQEPRAVRGARAAVLALGATNHLLRLPGVEGTERHRRASRRRAQADRRLSRRGQDRMAAHAPGRAAPRCGRRADRFPHGSGRVLARLRATTRRDRPSPQASPRQPPPRAAGRAARCRTRAVRLARMRPPRSRTHCDRDPGRRPARVPPTASSAPTAAAARCHARRSTSRSGSAAASARCASRRCATGASA